MHKVRFGWKVSALPVFAAGAIVCGAALADEFDVPEGNLLNNIDFALDASGDPAEWNQGQDPFLSKMVSVVDGALVFAPTNAAVSPRQRDILLAEGGKYRTGLWVKTKNFKPTRCSALVFNWAWVNEAGIISGFPADTHGKWVRLEKEFVAPSSRQSLFVYAIYVTGNNGELAIKRPWLVPVDELAKSKSRRAPRSEEMVGVGKRLYPPRPAKCTYKPERRLNSLVVRLKTGKVTGSDVGFSATRDGWIWISMEKGGRETKAYLDGKEVIRFREGERFETMRRVAAGDHTLRFEGGEGGGFVVNEIPQISTYPYPRVFRSGSSWIANECRPFGGEFCRKYLLPTMNTFSYGYARGTIPLDEVKDLQERGVELVLQTCCWNKSTKGYDGSLESPEHLAERLLGHGGQTDPFCGGTSYDEIDMTTVSEKWNYAQAMRRLADASRPHYTWSSGSLFVNTPLNVEYLSACLDVAKGHGRFLFEFYPRAVATEQEVTEFLDRYNEPIRRAKRMLPGCEDGLMMIMGQYNTYGVNSYNAFSDIDTKRFYDLFLRHLATDPEFTGIGGTGLYAFNNGKEEDVRWVSRMFRHYLLEGRRDLLSDSYGYVYRPGLITNGTFADGLAGWTAQPSEKGAIEVRTLKGLGSKGMKIRSTHASVGDTAVVFKRSPRGASFLTAKIRGLKPGALYSFRYGVGDVKGLKAKEAPARRRLGIEADLDGVELVTGKVGLGRYGIREYQNPYYNYRLAVFKALSEEAEVQFSNVGAGNGEELSLNAVSVVPYFAE